jgi:hypothetical protein
VSELSWLYKHDKFLPAPKVVFAPVVWCSGYYWHPCGGEREVMGSMHDGRKGLIVVSSAYSDGDTANTLAHEWRHHWQWCNGVKFDHTEWDSASPLGYWGAIKEFFRNSRTEYDALMFSLKVAPTKLTREWRGLL